MSGRPPTEPCVPFGTRLLPCLRADRLAVIEKIDISRLLKSFGGDGLGNDRVAGDTPATFSNVCAFPRYPVLYAQFSEHRVPRSNLFPLLPDNHADASPRTPLALAMHFPLPDVPGLSPVRLRPCRTRKNRRGFAGRADFNIASYFTFCGMVHAQWSVCSRWCDLWPRGFSRYWA